MTARIPTFEPCHHKWVARTLRWCPDCDTVDTVEGDVWGAGWASGWTEAIFQIRQLVKDQASSHTAGVLQKIIDEANAEVMRK
jgi:hypothetical protein